ncbi:MAG: hypothetical protein JNJ99_06455, partial [Crocinitomicaceae bacterium]|nr:hypothetical protein [Crocinitomicaceae bacterium]
MYKISGISLISLALALNSCGGSSTENQQTSDSTSTDSVIVTEDAHSYSNVEDVYSSHLHLNLNVDFDRKVLAGNVIHDIENVNGVSEIIFDMNDENILKVTLDEDTSG